MSTVNPNTQIIGIFQSDLILKSAIETGFGYLRDINKDAWVLDYIWQGLNQDKITQKAYGQNEINRLKEWYQNTDIQVAVTPLMNEFKLPMVTITLLESSEFESVIGDVFGAEPRESIANPVSPQISLPFNGVYDPTNGAVTIPPEIDTTPFYPGMYLVSAQGQSYQLLDIITDNVFIIEPNLTPNLSNVTLQSAFPSDSSYVVDVEGYQFKETFRIGVFADSSVQDLLFLHSIVMTILLRYRQTLLEARGFARMSISSANLERMIDLNPELSFGRGITLSAVTQSVLPKYRFPAISGVGVNPTFVPVIEQDNEGSL